MSDAFTIIKDGKKLDYRVGYDLDEAKLIAELSHLGYSDIKISKLHRHYVGHLFKNNIKYFIKISTSEGMNETTKHEVEWTNKFHEIAQIVPFTVPNIISSGLLLNQYYYYISEWIDGRLLVDFPTSRSTEDLASHLPDLVNMALYLENLSLPQDPYIEKCIEKTTSWYDAIPESVVVEYDLKTLLNYVNANISNTKSSPRHGDFAPWHIFVTENKLTLFDFEHFLPTYVAHYDIAYMAQRIWGELGDEELAKRFINLAVKQGIDINSLLVPLAMRAIGGFLDSNLGEKNYTHHQSFANFVKSNF